MVDKQSTDLGLTMSYYLLQVMLYVTFYVIYYVKDFCFSFFPLFLIFFFVSSFWPKDGGFTLIIMLISHK